MEKSLLKHLAERKTENIFLFSEISCINTNTATVSAIQSNYHHLSCLFLTKICLHAAGETLPMTFAFL